VLSFLQAIVIGAIQGVAELFPISSLGHTVIIPAFIGGSWSRLVTQQASAESPYLAFVVGLHVATALALILVFRREWARILRGLGSSILKRRAETPQERAAWFVIVATIPVGLLGLLFEHEFRTLFAKPIAAASFLTVNGLILLTGEWFRRNARRRVPATAPAGPGAPPLDGPVGGGVVQEVDATDSIEPLASLRWRDAVVVGLAQSSALLAGISRDGVCMVTGLARRLTYEDAARFAFLLSAPPILAAGLLKVPDLTGSLGNGIRGQVLAGSAVAFVVAYASIRFLLRYFRSRTLAPFAAYCLTLGVAGVCYFGFA